MNFINGFKSGYALGQEQGSKAVSFYYLGMKYLVGERIRVSGIWCGRKIVGVGIGLMQYTCMVGDKISGEGEGDK